MGPRARAAPHLPTCSSPHRTGLSPADGSRWGRLAPGQGLTVGVLGTALLAPVAPITLLSGLLSLNSESNQEDLLLVINLYPTQAKSDSQQLFFFF